jgi:hypothetical protein
MSLVEITAKFACDDCGTEFIVGLEPPYVPPPEWSVFAVAENAIRRGESYEDGTEATDGLGAVDDNGRHYCDRCRRKMDKE